MRTAIMVLGALFALPAGARDGSSATIVDAALLGSELVTVDDGGAVDAWSIPSRERDEALSAALSARVLERIASDGSTLWGASESKLFKWSTERRVWVRDSELSRETDAPIDLLCLGAEPVVVYPRKVVRPLAEKAYLVPRLSGQLSIDSLRVLATHVAAPNIWFGTGEGEWGGHLVRLDTGTGRWVSYYDPLHYVTGITQSAPDRVTVTWSMSHMGAETLVRVHDLEAKVLHEGPVLEGQYFQSIAYVPAARTLFAIEQNRIVQLRPGKPTPVCDLGRLPYAPEAHAVGVAPGVLALLPLPDGTLLIVHRSASPMILEKRALSHFKPERYKNVPKGG